MEKISLHKKSFFNSIGLDVNNVPHELQTKVISMENSLPKEDIKFLSMSDLAVMEQKYFRLRNLVGIDNSEYDGKTWLEVFIENEKSDDIAKLYFKNPNYYYKDLRKIDATALSQKNAIELYEDNGKLFIKEGVSRLSLLMTKYLLEMSRATTKEERAVINKQYIFSANVKSVPKDRDIVYLVVMLEEIFGSKIKIKRNSLEQEHSYIVTYGEKEIQIKSKAELEALIRNNYLPKEYKTEERLKNRIQSIAELGSQYENDNEDYFMVIGKIFPNHEIFSKYYKKMISYNLEEKFYSKLNMENIEYEQVLKDLINMVKQEENDMKKKNESVKTKKEKKVVEKKPEKKAEDKEKKAETSKAKSKEKGKKVKEETTENVDVAKKKISDQISELNNAIEMMFYKFKAEESKVFDISNKIDVTLNVDKIHDDSINLSRSTIKTLFMEIERNISDEEDIKKISNINDFIVKCQKNNINGNLVTEYKDEMQRIFSACLNKHIQKIITDSKLDKLDLQKEEIEKEKCSFFSKLIGKAKLKQAKLDNINLKRQLILSESQYADKLNYYIEEGLSDLYAYVKSEEDVRCLGEAKAFIRLIETNKEVQDIIDNSRLNRQIKEKVEQKKNLPQLALSKEKRRLFSKAQINLMEEKNNELKRVIQITRANSLKQQNTGMIPILGNIKITKSLAKFCNDLTKIEHEIRSIV